MLRPFDCVDLTDLETSVVLLVGETHVGALQLARCSLQIVDPVAADLVVQLVVQAFSLLLGLFEHTVGLVECGSRILQFAVEDVQIGQST